MAGVVLPDALAWALDLTGIEWPNIDDDDRLLDAVVELGVLAGEIIACQAAAPFTFGASELAIPGAVRASGRIVEAIFDKIAEPA